MIVTSLSPEVNAYLVEVNRKYPGLLDTSMGRRTLTKYNPMLFAIVYLRHHLDGDGHISIPPMHMEWYEQMMDWVTPPSRSREWRHAYLAPRESAKSTVWFLFAPLWAGAHGHVKFFAGFGRDNDSAMDRLGDIKKELETNELLRQDYPDLCAPLKRARGTTFSDTKSEIEMKNGFIVIAGGIKAGSHGMKRGSLRPEVILLDDIELGEENYSLAEAESRLKILRQDIFYLSKRSRTVLVGTVTMPGSITHQLVKPMYEGENHIPEKWIKEENFKTFYYPAIVTDEEGEEKSFWEEQFPYAEMVEERNTIPFVMNMMNKPRNKDGIWWKDESIISVATVDRSKMDIIISLDPATTTNSDYSAISVVGQDLETEEFTVLYSAQEKVLSNELRTKVEEVYALFPEAYKLVIEVNQGGSVWESSVFDGFDLPIATVQQNVPKPVRAEWLLSYYEGHRIFHYEKANLNALEDQLLNYDGKKSTKTKHDDLIDSVGTAITGWFTGKGMYKKPSTKVYVEPKSLVLGYAG